MPDLVVIFRTHSDIEAQIVRGLLETHGIMSVMSSDIPHSVFPLSVDGLGETRLSVHHSEAEDAQRIIESHRTELKSGEVIRRSGLVARARNQSSVGEPDERR